MSTKKTIYLTKFAISRFRSPPKHHLVSWKSVHSFSSNPAKKQNKQMDKQTSDNNNSSHKIEIYGEKSANSQHVAQCFPWYKWGNERQKCCVSTCGPHTSGRLITDLYWLYIELIEVALYVVAKSRLEESGEHTRLCCPLFLFVWFRKLKANVGLQTKVTGRHSWHVWRSLGVWGQTFGSEVT